MDLSNYRSNPHYDELIQRIANNELSHEHAMSGLLKNGLISEPNAEHQSNEYFVSYFINSLHLSCYWIISNSAANQGRSLQSSPVKSILASQTPSKPFPLDQTPSSTFPSFSQSSFNTTPAFGTTNQPPANQISVKKTPSNEKFGDVKRRLLFDRFDAKAENSFEGRFQQPAKPHKQAVGESKAEKLNLRDEESFPELNTYNSNSSFKKTPTSTPSSVGKISSRTGHDQPRSSKKQPRIIRPTPVDSSSKRTPGNTLFEKAPVLEQKDALTRDDIKKMTDNISTISLLTPKKKDPAAGNLQLLVRTPSKTLDPTPVVQPSAEKVTVDRTKLANLTLFYTGLIKRNLIANILTELDFLIQLVTRRSTNEQSGEFLSAFDFCSNYHNCLMFAVSSLEQLYDDTLVNYFDEPFFKTLSTNEAIRRLSPDFQAKLANCEQLLGGDEQVHDLSTAILQQNASSAFDFIAYQPETDSNENFLNENSFHLFRRQRDAFFKLYYEWKQLYTKKAFKQDSILNDQEFKFVNKVAFIFSLSKDFANYFHLARLFLAQLMQCCTGSSTANVEQTIADLIKAKATTSQSTPNVCESKMKKLNRRFQQQDQKVMATQSSFTGEEIFFYDFIVACNNYSFLTVLQSLLIAKITELNDPQLLMDAIDFDENNLEIASRFCTDLLNLQLLAKFLGLIVFMPFYSKMGASAATPTNRTHLNNLNEIVRNMHSDESSLCRRINEMIRSSLRGKHLICTLPWVIQFLNQMDSNTTGLTSYDQTFALLVDIYHELGLKAAQYAMDRMNYAYLKLVFGNFLEKYLFVCHVRLFEVAPSSELLCCTNDAELKTLDSFQLINKKFLNACFPKLFVIKEMLKQGRESAAAEIRKIKPLALNGAGLNQSLTTPPAKPDKKNLVQIEFEENFFRLHTDSLRKTVEFVADRLHSKCIKTLRHDVIKKVKRETFARHSDLSKTSTILEEIKQESLRFVREFANSHVAALVDLLVSEHDFSQNTIGIAKSIALRMLLDKCLNWMSNNMNDSWMINETLVENSRRSSETSKTAESSGSTANQPVPNISNCFNRVRDVICDLLFKNELTCSRDELTALIDELRRLRNSRSNLNARTNQVIETTMVDLITTLVTYQPRLIDSEYLQKFVAFYEENQLSVNRFISPRNFYILSLSKEASRTWDKYESILVRFVKREIYSIQSLETDILWVLGNKNEFDDEMLRKLASCLKSVVESCKSEERFKVYAEKIEILDWTSWLCSGQSDET